MLTVQTTIGSVEVELRRAAARADTMDRSTGAQRSDAAMGQANASEDHVSRFLLSHTAVSKPTSTRHGN